MKKQLIFLLAFFPVFFMACDSGDENGGAEFNKEVQASYEGEETVEAIYNAVESVTGAVILASDANPGGRQAELSHPMLACAEVTFDGNLNGGRIEVDFGEGCEAPNGKVISGIIVVEYEGLWIMEGSKVYVVLKDFFIDDVEVEGTIIYTNAGMDMKSWVFTVEIVGGKITWPDGTTVTRESDRTHTLTMSGDEFELQIEGTASGTTRMGYAYTSEITEPLLVKSSCLEEYRFLPVSGKKLIKVDELGEATIDYGDGTCDNTFTVTFGGVSKDVTISS